MGIFKNLILKAVYVNQIMPLSKNHNVGFDIRHMPLSIKDTTVYISCHSFI